MQVERNQSEDGAILVRLSGVVADVGQERLSISQFSEDDCAGPILIGLRDVTLLNSTGIGFLLQLNRQVKRLGGRLVLHSLPPYVRQVIDFMKLDKVLQIAKGEQDAHKMLS